ncbi:MAG: YqcC family protein [Pseudomonadota bacterium]
MTTAVAELLIDVEAQLRIMDLWDGEPPPVSALASDQPFCFDTLTFPQWLQFVFLPRLYGLLEAGEPLPQRCGIAPMAEEYFKDLGLPSVELQATLKRIDHLLSSPRGDD